MQKTSSVECIVLKSSPYKDSDKLYTLFSPTLGKFVASGRNIRKINSKRLGNLDTLNCVTISFAESFDNIRQIHQVQIIYPFKYLKNSFSGIAKGLYMAELIHRFFYNDAFEHESSSDVYSLLIKSLGSLDRFYLKYPQGNFNFIPVRIMNVFEARLMRVLGYEMSFDNFLTSGLGLKDSEVTYLKTLKSGSKDLTLFRDAHKGANEVIKNYVSEVLDEQIYSRKLL